MIHGHCSGCCFHSCFSHITRIGKPSHERLKCSSFYVGSRVVDVQKDPRSKLQATWNENKDTCKIAHRCEKYLQVSILIRFLSSLFSKKKKNPTISENQDFFKGIQIGNDDFQFVNSYPIGTRFQVLNVNPICLSKNTRKRRKEDVNNSCCKRLRRWVSIITLK